MKLQYAILLVFVAAIAGYFVHPVIEPCDTIQAPTQPVVITHGPVKPDTVIIEKYIKKEVPVYVTEYKTEYQDRIVIDTIYVTKEIPLFRSYEIFYEDYLTSEVYAWAEAPVDSFYNKVQIDYNRYFNDVYSNKVRTEKRNAYLVGGAIGIGVGVITALLIQ